MGYLTFELLKVRSGWDPGEWDDLLARRPGTPAAWLEDTQSAIDDPLRLRYAVPFAAPVPRAVLRWQTRLMDALFLRARRQAGVPLGEDADLYAEERATLEAIAAAADQDRPAHSELPLRSDTASSGVVKGGPLMQSFATMHSWFDYQAQRRDEESG